MYDGTEGFFVADLSENYIVYLLVHHRMLHKKY
jgi:hypothetical protein